MAYRSGGPKVLVIVLAGGEGKRLMPLTADRAKPAVPFGGIYRLIDFALSNVVNSGYLKVVVLTQYKSHSLDRHVTRTWRMSTMLGNYVAPIPAQQRIDKSWYQGSADAIFQSFNTITDEKPDIVVVVGADHVYRMDFSQMVEQHVESRAGVTVAAIRQPIAMSTEFGVIDVVPDDPTKIRAFLEKPAAPDGLPDSPGEILASMGNYVFDADVLMDAVHADATLDGSKHDMGGDIVPALVEQGAAYAYDFKNNVIPGGTERDMGYWRDVGTMDSYFDAHMDLVSIHPIFNLYNYDWPIYTSYGPYPPAKFVHGHHGRFGEALNSAVSPGVVISGRADQRLGRLPRRARAQLHRGRQQRDPRRRADRAELPHPAGDHRQERHDPRCDVDRVRPRARRGARLLGHRVGHHRRRQGPGGHPVTGADRPIRIGVQLQPQHATYAALRQACADAEEIGVDVVFTWDHFYPLYGPADGAHFECWTMLAAWAEATSRVEIGALVTCNSYRNPQLLADMARTVDHISDGRLILGIGSGWFERDYDEYGYEFGTAGRPTRRARPRPAAHQGHAGRSSTRRPPATSRCSSAVAGSARRCGSSPSRRTSGTASAGPTSIAHKHAVLDEWCRKVGRDPGRDRALVRGLPEAGTAAGGRRRLRRGCAGPVRRRHPPVHGRPERPRLRPRSGA